MSGDVACSTIVARRLTLANVHEAETLLQSAISDPCLDPASAVGACRELLARRSMMGVLVDACGPDRKSRVVGVGGGAFVSHAFVEKERRHPRQGVLDRVLRSVLESRSVALDAQEIAAANAGDGLDIAVILHHWQKDVADSVKREVRRYLMEKFLDDIRGFRMREVLAEARETDELPWCLAGGFRLRSDSPTQDSTVLPGEARRMLVGITREEALESEGSMLSLIFHHSPPQFGFTPSQRRLLFEAIQPRTDVEIARALGVSLSAVKKTWAGIFDRASVILDADADEAGSRHQPATRGAQKRHVLLTYLREHPEELRP
jgi:hypothetical protein